MSDITAAGGVVLPTEARAAMEALEKQIAGLESMIPGAKQAGMDTRTMEATVSALKSSLAALKGIPGVG